MTDNSVLGKVAYFTAPGVLTVYENMIVYKSPLQLSTPPAPPIREIDDIETFSLNSRRRLFKLLNAVRFSEYHNPLFLSLTYHYDSPDNKSSLKLFLDNFIKRLNRALPAFDYIWRLEPQHRGTPHFHFIVLFREVQTSFNLDKIISSIKSIWLSLKTCKCSDCSTHAVRTNQIKDFKHLSCYISKYLAKIDSSIVPFKFGRFWGYSRTLNLNPFDSIELSPSSISSLLDYILQNIDTGKYSKEVANNFIADGQSFSFFVNNKLILSKLVSLIRFEAKNKNFSFSELLELSNIQSNSPPLFYSV